MKIPLQLSIILNKRDYLLTVYLAADILIQETGSYYIKKA